MREVRGVPEMREVGVVTKNLFPSQPPFYPNGQVNRHSASTSKIGSPEVASQSCPSRSRVPRRTSQTVRYLVSTGGAVRFSGVKARSDACISKPVPIEDAPRSHEMRCTTASGGKRCRK